MIVKAVDSEFPPSAASLLAAKADGVIGWNGYLAGLHIANGWTAGDFAAVRAAGLHSIAYASGWSDPLVAKAQAASFGVRGCLDVEGSIRADGSWVQGWLNASGFGLYGNAPVHQGRIAAFHVLAAYPGHDPGTSWPAQKPPAPTGWQWAGSVAKYGTSVDLCNFDEAIYVTPSPAPPPTKGIPQMFIWYQTNGTISLCNGDKRIGFGDGADVTQFSAFPSVHESNVTIAFAAKINALPFV